MTTTLERYDHALMNTFGSPKRALVRGAGCHVWDDGGNRYLDLLAGIAVNALGHAHPDVVATIARQAATLGHISNFFTSEPQVALAERLLRLTRAADGRVFFTNSGTEANEAALKLTRRTGRTKVVAAEGGFHGRTMGALSLTGKAAYREPFAPLPGGVTFVPYGDSDALRAATDEVTAAIVLEPIQGEAGVIVPPDGYLETARRIADETGALLWFDEVQTGLGRTGRWFGYQHCEVLPDVITVAKGLGAGFPIGACIGLGAAGTLLEPGQHGTTFGGNPLAAATALTVLDVIERDELLGHVETVGRLLAERVAAIDGVAEVRGRGLHLAAELSGPTARTVAADCLAAGLIVNDCAPTTLRLVPPLILDTDHVDEALPTLAAAVGAHRHLLETA